MLRLDRPDGHMRVLCFEHFADAGDGAACADAGAEAVDGTFDLRQNFDAGMMAVHHRIGGIFKLLRYENLQDFRLPCAARYQGIPECTRRCRLHRE